MRARVGVRVLVLRGLERGRKERTYQREQRQLGLRGRRARSAREDAAQGGISTVVVCQQKLPLQVRNLAVSSLLPSAPCLEPCAAEVRVEHTGGKNTGGVERAVLGGRGRGRVLGLVYVHAGS